MDGVAQSAKQIQMNMTGNVLIPYSAICTIMLSVYDWLKDLTGLITFSGECCFRMMICWEEVSAWSIIGHVLLYA